MTFLSDLAELATATLTAQPGTEDLTGKFTAVGGALNLTDVRISGGRDRIRDLNGQEVVSSVKATVLSFNNLTVEGFRYTLPTDWPEPRTNLKALVVRMVEEDGAPSHEVVSFP